jgi:hypothetical protein
MCNTPYANLQKVECFDASKHFYERISCTKYKGALLLFLWSPLHFAWQFQDIQSYI